MYHNFWYTLKSEPYKKCDEVNYYFLMLCKEKYIFYTDQSCFDKKIAFSYHIKNHLFYYTRYGIFSLEKINLHLKGYKLKINPYFYTRKGAYYGIK
jgi:hypothetical protein